jgi:hypothetical protein
MRLLRASRSPVAIRRCLTQTDRHLVNGLLWFARHVSRRHSVRRTLTKSKSLLSPPPISPIAAPSEEQKEHEDNKNEVHIFLQKFLRELPSFTCGSRIRINQPRILPTYFFRVR